MGYTHYWTPASQTDDLTWQKFLVASRRVVELAQERGIALRGPMGWGDTQPDLLDRIALNGCADKNQDHESFVIPRPPAEGWDFCKTAYKPYDVVVTAILALGEHLKLLTATSDGGADDWQDGIKLASEALGETVSLPQEL